MTPRCVKVHPGWGACCSEHGYAHRVLCPGCSPTSFQFPPLDLGEPTPLDVSPPHAGRHGDLVWRASDALAYVTRQNDRHPGVLFRCHYGGCSTPCDLRTAQEFVAYHGGDYGRVDW